MYPLVVLVVDDDAVTFVIATGGLERSMLDGAKEDGGGMSGFAVVRNGGFNTDTPLKTHC
jgi:hypothetical protein